MIIKADDNCIGKKRTLHTGCGTLHCEAFFDPDSGDLLETYFSKGSTGGCASTLCGLSRMISLAARGGVDVYSIVDQLKSAITCPSYSVRTATKKDTSKGSSCPVAIGYALIDMYEELQHELKEDTTDSVTPQKTVKPKVVKKSEPTPSAEISAILISQGICPECGEKLFFEGGCMTCHACGWTKCD